MRKQGGSAKVQEMPHKLCKGLVKITFGMSIQARQTCQISRVANVAQPDPSQSESSKISHDQQKTMGCELSTNQKVAFGGVSVCDYVDKKVMQESRNTSKMCHA